jgi:hypothetical protein
MSSTADEDEDESERDLEPSERKGPEGEPIDSEDREADEGPLAPERGASDRPRAERADEDESGAEDERDFTQRNVGGKSELEP